MLPRVRGQHHHWRLSDYLRDAGHDVEHVRDYGLQAATDEEVLHFAGEHDRVLVSADADFETCSLALAPINPH